MPNPPHDNALQAVRVWLTRPAHQARSLAGRIEAQGGVAIQVPLMRIEPVLPDPNAPLLDEPKQYDYIIFVSANAVVAALPHFQAAGGLPLTAAIGAVGKGTAHTLRESLRREPELVPSRFDSEGLLALPALQDVSGKRVLIVRGDRGREVLADTLRERGAQVDYAGVYHRVMIDIDLQQDLQPSPDIILLTSSEALRHLAALARAQQQEWVFDKPLVVLHERIEALARELGFGGHIEVAPGGDEATVVETLGACVQYTGCLSKEDR